MNLRYDKYADGLVPAIVQDNDTGRVLMLGFVNAEAVEKTIATGLVTFYSRSVQRLWTKGQTSGNCLEFVSLEPDCDADTLLIKARPKGATCHTGTETCFGQSNTLAGFLGELESTIESRQASTLSGSYVASLFGEGLNKIAQKVGEEAVETVIAAKDDDADAFKNEAADLLFHLMVLLRAKRVSLGDVIGVLRGRGMFRNSEELIAESE